ncbi:MAG: LCCL domain-containing protein [Planctomycetota bacterium]
MKRYECNAAAFFALCVLASSAATAGERDRALPEIEWDTTLDFFRFDSEKFLGQRLTVRCPPLERNQSLDGVFGTDRYSSESPICLAALHAGKITKEGGTVTIQLMPGEESYEGSTKNGVTSGSLPSTKLSFLFVEESNRAAADRMQRELIPRIKWDTKFTTTGFAYRNLVGQRFTFRCPAAPSEMRSRLIYGTDRYDFSSLLCPAALHAGAITTDGGVLTVQLDKGSVRLVGSIRNGVETKSKRSGDRTLTFVTKEDSK